MDPPETWYRWFKFGTTIVLIGIIIYAVTMAFITAPN